MNDTQDVAVETKTGVWEIQIRTEKRDESGTVVERDDKVYYGRPEASFDDVAKAASAVALTDGGFVKQVYFSRTGSIPTHRKLVREAEYETVTGPVIV